LISIGAKVIVRRSGATTEYRAAGMEAQHEDEAAVY